MTFRKQLNGVERDQIKKIVDSTGNINSKKSQKILSRPHVAVALEAILDSRNLSDDGLIKKLHAVINRRPLKSMNITTGVEKTNQTSVDANTLSGIRMAFQLKGKFNDKDGNSAGGELANMPEDQLDKIIESGATITNVKRIEIPKKDTKDA